LNFISDKLPISSLVVGESGFLRSHVSIEGDVAFEGSGFSHVFGIISRLVMIGEDV
jgi:hypothetical protein